MPSATPVELAHSRALRDHLHEQLAAFPRQADHSAGLRTAAVALPVIRCDEQSAVLVTRRAPRLSGHANQWALPGGRLDHGETPVAAALRETHEEVGLQLHQRDVLGLLDDYVTRSGYRITPVVVWVDDKSSIAANPAEVASVHEFPFSELLRQDAPWLEQIPQSDRPVLSMPYRQDRIYAPTAAMLYQFREVALLGRDTRVHHYDQPLFAWK